MYILYNIYIYVVLLFSCMVREAPERRTASCCNYPQPDKGRLLLFVGAHLFSGEWIGAGSTFIQVGVLQEKPKRSLRSTLWHRLLGSRRFIDLVQLTSDDTVKGTRAQSFIPLSPALRGGEVASPVHAGRGQGGRGGRGGADSLRERVRDAKERARGWPSYLLDC